MSADPHALADELGFSIAEVEARGLTLCEEAAELELAQADADGRAHYLIPEAARAWRELKEAAAADGIGIAIASAYRSVDRQAELVRRKLAAGQSIGQALAVCAPPGFSEHHTGRAVDLAIPGMPALEAEFASTAAFAWLVRRAAEFGFHMSYPADNPQGYLYEPWHWCYREAEPTAFA
ncbi:MAG TPA: M15 family metallopeptidase [Rhodocyclaceae bacterium]|nr:M15 family metallopeptidase [Rhodocyclaceae bacterium]